jgi:bifunctional DNA-binding transcriptional regulator/antitoxin component of YhaV-PrlF toxin-antitoxin module
MVVSMNMKMRMKISKGGQISVPALIRRRWGSSTVVLHDEGHRIIIEPVADDAIGAAEGVLAAEFGHLREGRLRDQARSDEQAAEDRRSRT